eukprot:gene2431-2664_t
MSNHNLHQHGEDIDILGMETAFLIVTAASRDFDLNKWFNAKAYKGKIPVREFDAKITSLSTAMGINQSPEIKRELEISTSPVSLRVVHKICAGGQDDQGELLIDLHYLFKLSQEKVDEYLLEIQEKERADRPRQSSSSPDQDELAIEAEDYLADIQAIAESTNRPAAPVSMDLRSKVLEETSPLPLSAPAATSSMPQESEEIAGPIRATNRPAVLRGRYDEEEDVETEAHDVEDEYSQTFDQQEQETDLAQEAHESLRKRLWNVPVQVPEPVVSKDPTATASSLAPSTVTTKNSQSGDKVQNNDITDRNGPASDNTRRGRERDWAAENRRLLSDVSPMFTRSVDGSAASRQRSRSADQALRRLQTLGRNRFLEALDSVDRGRRGSLDGSRVRMRSSRSQSLSRAPAWRKDQENYFKDVVEDMLRTAARQADRYHLLQVCLGFLPGGYVWVPARGSIVVSQPVAWLSARALQSAFLAARTTLNESHLYALRLLLQDFADRYDTLYPNTTSPLPAATTEPPAGEIGDPRKGDPVLGPHHALSAAWLKKYLLHLRLTKRRQSYSVPRGTRQSAVRLSSAVAIAASMTEDDHLNGNEKKEEARAPAPWQVWLRRKVQEEAARGPFKPKELQRALLGQPHSLTRDDVRLLLTPHSQQVLTDASTGSLGGDSTSSGVDPAIQKKRTTILPTEVLEQEIELRLQLWVLDADGRRDFQHQMNIKLRTFLHKELQQSTAPSSSSYAASSSAAAKAGKTADEVFRAQWAKLAHDRRKEIKSAIVRELLDEHRELLRSQERNEGTLSIELFLQFTKHNQEQPTRLPWVDWLSAYLEKTRRHVERLREATRAHRQLDVEHKRQKQSMASLIAVETTLKELSRMFDNAHQLQLRKGMVALRKVSQSRGAGQVVTKEDFDRLVRPALAPFVLFSDNELLNPAVLDGEGGEVATVNQCTQIYRDKLLPLFEHDAAQTVNNVLAAEEDKTKENEKKFSQWLTEKKRTLADRKKKQMEDEARLRSEEEERKKKSATAYRKWLKLRQRNKYKSKMDNKNHDLPAPRPLQHPDKWRKDTEAKL